MRFPPDGIPTPFVDPLSGREVVIASGRARRPGASGPRIEEATPEELESCPFCAGREDRTPPETLRIGDPWRVRVVPNLYPAFERQEVVIHSPRHVRSFADLSNDECALVAEAWQRRARAARTEGLTYVHAFINEGQAAGASLAHSHSQLVWLPHAPPEVRNEKDDAGFDLLRLVLAEEGGKQPEASLAVERAGTLVTFCHPAGRAPYELVIQGAHGHDPGRNVFEGGDLAEALTLLRNAVRRLRAVEGPVPWNAWLHASARWHLHVLPRLSVFAGIELGAGIYVNALPPADAAAALRGADV